MKVGERNHSATSSRDYRYENIHARPMCHSIDDLERKKNDFLFSHYSEAIVSIESLVTTGDREFTVCNRTMCDMLARHPGP